MITTENTTTNSKEFVINGQKAKVTFVYPYKKFIDKIIVQFVENPLQKFVMYSDSTISLTEHSSDNSNSYTRIWYCRYEHTEFFAIEKEDTTIIQFDLLSKVEPSVLEKIEFIKVINSEIMKLTIKTI